VIGSKFDAGRVEATPGRYRIDPKLTAMMRMLWSPVPSQVDSDAAQVGILPGGVVVGPTWPRTVPETFAERTVTFGLFQRRALRIQDDPVFPPRLTVTMNGEVLGQGELLDGLAINEFVTSFVPGRP
jgi:hypothetical protein